MDLAGMGTAASTITKEKMLQVVSMVEAVMEKETLRRAVELPVVELKAAVQQAAERQAAEQRTVGQLGRAAAPVVLLACALQSPLVRLPPL